MAPTPAAMVLPPVLWNLLYCKALSKQGSPDQEAPGRGVPFCCWMYLCLRCGHYEILCIGVFGFSFRKSSSGDFKESTKSDRKGVVGNSLPDIGYPIS